MGSSIQSLTEVVGVKVWPLKQFFDERGFVKHMLRCDSKSFIKFGEIYFSFVKHRITKGWKIHHRITQSMAVPHGLIRLVLYDAREGSPSFGTLVEATIGDDNYFLVQIPPKIIYGFQGLGPQGSLIANCLDEVYDPHESDAIALDSKTVPYQWDMSTQ